MPRAGPAARTTSHQPRATPVLQLPKSQKRIPTLPDVNSERCDVAEDIIHFNALREAGTAWNPAVPMRRHQYTREFKLAEITYAQQPPTIQQLSPTSDDQPDLPSDTEDERSDVDIDEDEGAGGSGDEGGTI